MDKNEITSIAKRTGLKITSTDNYLHIKQQVNWRSKSTLGLLLLLCGGIVVGVVPFIKESDTISKVFGISLGLLFTGGSILTLIRDAVDGLRIEAGTVTIRYHLRRVAIPATSILGLRVTTDLIEVKTGTSGSEFICITHFIKTTEKEIPVLRFSMDKSEADEAIKLGNMIKRTVDHHISERARSRS